MSDFFVHETAIVDSGASIGAKTKIWHFSHIFSKAVIGQSCNIGQNVVVSNNVRVGDFCKIQNNISLYEGVELEDYVFCGPSMVFTNVRTPRSEYPRNTAVDYGKTLIRRGASIGANSTIVCGITIEKCGFVAAGAVVTKNVGTFEIVAGVPAQRIGWMSAYGDVLSFDTSKRTTDSIGDVYEIQRDKTVARVDDSGSKSFFEKKQEVALTPEFKPQNSLQ